MSPAASGTDLDAVDVDGPDDAAEEYTVVLRRFLAPAQTAASD